MPRTPACCRSLVPFSLSHASGKTSHNPPGLSCVYHRYVDNHSTADRQSNPTFPNVKQREACVRLARFRIGRLGWCHIWRAVRECPARVFGPSAPPCSADPVATLMTHELRPVVLSLINSNQHSTDLTVRLGDVRTVSAIIDRPAAAACSGQCYLGAQLTGA